MYSYECISYKQPIIIHIKPTQLMFHVKFKKKTLKNDHAFKALLLKRLHLEYFD